MFLRIKKINNAKYAYLVDNKWYKKKTKGKGKGPRQKVKKYLGRVYSFDKSEVEDFFTFKKITDFEQYLGSNEKEDIIKDLVEWELFRHNIGNEFFIKFDKKKVLKDNKEVSLAMNEGFLNGYTLARLLNFKFGHDVEKAGLDFAKYFVEAGIQVPKEIFVGIFGKMYGS